MNNIITAMQKYIFRMNIGRRSQELYALKDKEQAAILEALASSGDAGDVVDLVFNYGFAKGWRSHSKVKNRHG